MTKIILKNVLKCIQLIFILIEQIQNLAKQITLNVFWSDQIINFGIKLIE